MAVTARSLSNLKDLKDKYGDQVLTLELDVTKPDQVKRVVEVISLVFPARWALYRRL